VARGCDGVEANVRADVDEVTLSEVFADEVELAPVVQPEQKIALERLAQVELEPEAAGEARLRGPLGTDRKDRAQSTLPAEVETAEEGVESTLEHRPKLT
jgi:hypothetical protein